VSPSGGPPPPERDPNLVEVAGRLLEIANWRDLQTELRLLPPEWEAGNTSPSESAAESVARAPARVCVIEPDAALPGGIYGFSPERAGELIRRGEADAWAALVRAGWIVHPSNAAASPATARADRTP